MAPFHIALEEGFFRDVALDVEVTQVTSSAAIIPLLAGGRADVGLVGMSPAFANAVKRGARIRIVGGREHVRPACPQSGAMLIRKSAFPGGLSDLRELKGKRVAIGSWAGAMHGFFLDLVLNHAGLTHDDLTILDLRGRERFAALVRGDIDAVLVLNDFSGFHPGWSNDLAYVQVISRIVPGFQYGFIQFGARLLDGDSAAGAAFLAAYLRGVRAFADGKTPRFVEEYAKSNGLDFETLKAHCRAAVSLDGAIDRESLQRYLDWLARQGFVDGRMDAADLIDARFLEAASATHGDVR